MTTNYNDFLFTAMPIGTTVGYANHHYNLRAALGGPTDNNGTGYAAVGSPILNSGLSNPLPNSIAGTYARGWRISEAANYTGTADTHCGGVAVLNKTAAGNTTWYPTYDVTSSVVAYSCRAFLRLDDPDSQGTATGWGTNVGLVHKNEHWDGTTQYVGRESNSDETLHDIFSNNGTPGGYCVALSNMSTCYHDRSTLLGDGGNNAGTNSAPRLIIVAPNTTVATQTGGASQSCSGTYAVNTWYHVRFDMIPNGSDDDLKVYTAPVSGAGSAATAGIGSETWTLVGSLTVSGGSPHYRPWAATARNGGNNRQAYSGYWFTAASNAANASAGTFDPMIDRFQFLMKDIS